MEKTELEQKVAMAQLQRAELDNQRLTLELEKLRKPALWFQAPLQFVPLVTAIVSVAGLLWGINQYFIAQKSSLDARIEQTAQEKTSREREFMAPWLKSQRDIYEEALEAATTATNSRDPKLRDAANDKFWQLYYGRMVLVETREVSGAMGRIGECLRQGATCTQESTRQLLLPLASTMAKSMADTAKMPYEEFSTNQFLYGREAIPRQD